MNGVYTHVCSGGVYGDGRLGSECVSAETLTPQPPPPPLPPFPPAPPEPPPAPPWSFSGELSFVAENIELIGSLVAVVFVIFAVSALWKYWSRRKRQPVPVTRQVEMMPAGRRAAGMVSAAPGSGGRADGATHARRAVSPQYHPRRSTPVSTRGSIPKTPSTIPSTPRADRDDDKNHGSRVVRLFF